MHGCILNLSILFFVNLLIIQVTLSEATSEYIINAVTGDNISVNIDFFPRSISNMPTHSVKVVFWNYSASTRTNLESNSQWAYKVIYASDDIKVAQPVHVPLHQNDTNIEILDKYHIKKSVVHNGINKFGISGEGLGRTNIKIKLLREDHRISSRSIYANVSTNSSNFTIIGTTPPLVEFIRESKYSVTVIRAPRVVDEVFRWVVAVTGIITTFAVGCVTDCASLPAQFKKPGGIIITVVCKALILPPLSFAVSRAFQLSHDMTLGLLYTTCVPSGGLGFFLTCAFKGDKDLALALHFVIAFLTVGSLPLWVFVLGSLTESTTVIVEAIEWFTIWLTCAVAAFLLGLTLRLCHLKTADQLLEWLVKPTLLLFSLVYVTIGMYINSYAFALLDTMSTVAVAILPCSAFLFAQILGYFFRQERKCRTAIGCEISTFNGLVLLGMIHFTLPKLEADLVATVPLLMMLVTPIPFILWYFGHKLKVLFSDKYNNNNLNSMKNMEKNRKNSVASSLINDTNVTNLSSSQSPQTPGSPVEENSNPEDENDVFLDQITAL